MPFLKPAKDHTEAITSELFKHLVKPKGYSSLEVKDLGGDRYRVNVLCSDYATDNSLIASASRPHSYYVKVEGEEITFNPPVN